MPDTTRPLVRGCDKGSAFTEGGEVVEVQQQASDASTIGFITWDARPDCESLTISFESEEGAPATTPPSTRIEYLPGAPIIRIWLEADDTVITDQLVETSLIDRLYIVRSLSGGMFIDVYLGSPAQAHATFELSPARLVLDLQPGIVEYRNHPKVTESVIVTSPVDGATVGEEATVTGYARTFEAAVEVIATAGDVLLDEQTVTAADWSKTWGEFSADLQLQPGPVSLFVGERAPSDGTLEGVTINITAQ
jgi:hypothetical protein